MYKKLNRMPIAAQAFKLQHDYPDSKLRWINHSGFVWKTNLTPSEISHSYTVEIRYSADIAEPKVFIVSPAPLELFEGAKELPHVFDHTTQQICLHFYGEWNPTRPVTDFVPWASKWLFSYETWVVTGVWIGKSFHNGEYTY